MQELIEQVGDICSLILAIFSIIGTIYLFAKKGKKKVFTTLQDKMGVTAIVENQNAICVKLDTHIGQDTKRDQDIELLKHASLTQIKKDLKYMCGDVIKKEFITIREREVINDSYTAYCKLNGNSFIKDLYKVAMDQETREV